MKIQISGPPKCGKTWLVILIRGLLEREGINVKVKGDERATVSARELGQAVSMPQLVTRAKNNLYGEHVTISTKRKKMK